MSKVERAESSGEEESVKQREKLLGQLRYVGSELDALDPFLHRIDDAVLHQEPIDGSESIYQSFVSLTTTQEQFVRVVSPTLSLGLPQEGAGLAELLQLFVEQRSELLEHLSQVEHEAWIGDLLAGLYQLVLSESTTLQSITSRLYESNLFRL